MFKKNYESFTCIFCVLYVERMSLDTATLVCINISLVDVGAAEMLSSSLHGHITQHNTYTSILYVYLVCCASIITDI